jgi:hypothetical protein
VQPLTIVQRLERAERLPSKQRQAALAIAEAWFQAAMDAAAKEAKPTKNETLAKVAQA